MSGAAHTMAFVNDEFAYREERRRGVTLTFFGPIETVTDRRAIKANRIPLEFDVNTEEERGLEKTLC